MKCNYVLLSRINPVQSGTQAVQGVVVSYHHENIAGPHAQSPGCQVVARLKIELIKFCMGRGASACDRFGYFKNCEEDDRESDSGDRCNLFGEEVDSTESDQRERYQGEPNGYFGITNSEIQRYAILAFARLFVTKHEHGQALHRETPHHTECVRFAQDKDVATAQDNREELQGDHEVQDPVRSAELAMWLAEPFGKNSIFGDSVQYAF